jgi:hypothetical protein
MNAAFMLFQLHERGIHVVGPAIPEPENVTDVAGVTKASLEVAAP